MRKEGLADESLRSTVTRVEAGQIDADLGGGVLKQRVARPGQGKSKGYRVIIFFRRGSNAFFMYGFAKSDQANISDHERAQFIAAATHILALTDEKLVALLATGDFVEVNANEQEISK